ncbi:MAG TPA: iron ABC transporter permease [Bacteroidota bacterium]
MTSHPSYLTGARALGILSVLVCLLIAVSAISLSIGASAMGVSDLWNTFRGEGTAMGQVILFELRLPRLLLAIVVGAGLSVAGAALQSLLRNPLAEPYILGISSGGTVGAFVAITFGLAWGAVTAPLLSFVGSGLVMLLVYSLGHRRGILDPNALLLSGVMVGAFFNAVILVAVAVFNQELRTAYLWLLGNLSGAALDSLAVVGPLIALASGVLMMQSRALNLIATGDESALQAGIDVERVRKLSYIMASLITGLAVSVSGVIGFVGLLVPHICRLIFGSDNRIIMPASFLVGGIFLTLCDILSRVLLAPAEIPVGAITAAVGAPLFVYLLKR